MTDPKTFTRGDADRILRRAAEIDGAEDSTRLTAAELLSIATEAGLGARAVERALAEAAQGAALAEVHRPPVQRWGLIVTHLSAIREVPIEINSDELMRIVRLVQPYRDGPAHVKLDEREITWQDRKGLRFAISSAAGMTEIRVFASKLLLRRGRWMGWVKAAADRLEALVQLVARPEGAAEARGRLPAAAPQEGGRKVTM